MKKSIEISVHLTFWLLITAFAVMLSKVYLEAKPDAPFASHFLYVIFLEVVMGLIFFYVTFFGIPWTEKKKANLVALVLILLFLLLFFAFPAMKFGFLQVMSSVIPHIIIIFLAFIFRKFSDAVKPERG
jgi:purine-cytosine permease-like protein